MGTGRDHHVITPLASRGAAAQITLGLEELYCSRLSDPEPQRQAGQEDLELGQEMLQPCS